MTVKTKKQVKKTVAKKAVAKKAPVCKKCKCAKPVKVSVEAVKAPAPKKSFWTKVAEFFGF